MTKLPGCAATARYKEKANWRLALEIGGIMLLRVAASIIVVCGAFVGKVLRTEMDEYRVGSTHRHFCYTPLQNEFPNLGCLDLGSMPARRCI
jgi:hypothetical protein